MEPSAKPEAGLVDEMILLEEVKDYVARVHAVNTNINKVYALVWGQCTDGLQEAIRLKTDFGKKSAEFDGFWLLEQVEKKLARVTNTKNACILLRNKMVQYLTTCQYDNESIHQYMTRFMANSKALKMIGRKNVLCN